MGHTRPKLVGAHVERLSPYVPGKPIEELERETGVRDAIKLASNENPLGASPRVSEALVRASEELHRYPDAAVHRLREELASFLGVPGKQLAFGNGSNELIDLICRTFALPGERVVYPAPSFVCYRICGLAAALEVVEVPLDADLGYDVDALLHAATPQTRMVFLANPNNPTGTLLPREALRRLLRELPEGVLLVLDEAYAELADSPGFVSGLSLRAERERLIVLRTFSKAYGLAALRVGYAVASPEVVGFLDRVRNPFNVNSLAQQAAIAALGDQGHMQRYVAMNRAERSRVARLLSGLGLRVYPSQANFLLVDFSKPAVEVYEALLRRGVIVRPMGGRIDTCQRISLGTAAENDRLIEAIQSIWG